MSSSYCTVCGTPHGPSEVLCQRCGTTRIEQGAALVGVGGPPPVGPTRDVQTGGPPRAVPSTPVTGSWGPAPPPYPPAPAGPSTSPRRLGPAGWATMAEAVVLLIGLGIAAFLLLRGGEDEPQVTSTAAEVTEPPETAAEADEVKPGAVRAPIAEDGASVDVAAAGIDFAWLRLPSVAAYPAFGWVVDDTEAITVQVPDAWADRNGATNSIDGVTTPSIWVAPDLDALVNRWTGSGAMVELLTGAPASGPLEDVRERMAIDVDADDTCGTSRDYVYDDGWYLGVARLHADCGTAGSALLQIAAAEGPGRVLTVQVQMTSTADVDAAVLIINTFQAVGQDAPAPAAAPAPAPAPAAPAPAPAPGTPSGLMCRDLEARGFDYAEAVAYWEREGRPDRMDADRNGIPCETVYPAWEVEGYWGIIPPADPPADDEYVEALALLEDRLRACGYSTTLDTMVDGPFPDGGYTVSTSVDVGWDIVYAQFEVFPFSGDVYGFDAVADDLLSCGY